MISRIVIGVFSLSLSIALLAMFFGYGQQAKYIGAPALILSGLVAIGHLVTLDEDAPGEWSNPDGSKSIWHHSLMELSIKILVFIAVLIAIYA